MKKEKKITHYYTSFFREIAISRTKKLQQLMILYTTCSLRPENTIHSDQQNKKSHPLCVLYPTLPIKKNVFCSTIHRRKMPKNILQITSHHVFKYHHWTIFYKTKTNFSCWLVFKKNT